MFEKPTTFAQIRGYIDRFMADDGHTTLTLPPMGLSLIHI